MGSVLEFNILPQPDETTCGPTCLHGIYSFYERPIDLGRLISEVPTLEEGGTLAVFLACHALRSGYKATIYTYNLQLFDPSWFNKPEIDLAERLEAQIQHKDEPKLGLATEGYLEFLRLGGRLKFEDLRPNLLRRYLNRGIPILTGLSATYLYRTPREFGPNADFDDLRGEPSGHFVVLSGLDAMNREVHVADPFHPNPAFESHNYWVPIERVIGAVLLGILTYDANLLVIEQ